MHARRNQHSVPVKEQVPEAPLHKNMQILNYADMQICRYADMQICRYADT
jgi:hypothetical protein